MAVDYLSAIGAGSGLNITELTDALVEAERAPQQEIIDRKTESTELRISAYGILKSSINTLKSAFAELDDLSEIASNIATSSNKANLTASANSSAVEGSYDIEVVQLAKRDTWAFDGFSSTTESLNSGQTFTLNVVQASGTTTINVSDPTPSGIADALNNANIGVTASLINTGTASNPFVLSVSGSLGSANAFSLSSEPTSVLTGATNVSTARDSEFTVNGLTIFREANTVTDVAEGVTFSLAAEGSATVQVAKDGSVLRDKLRNLVEAFNGVKEVFNTLRGSVESDDELAGALSTDSTFRSIESAIRNKLSEQISSATGDINYLADIGISFQRNGTLALDDVRLETALANNFDDVVSALSNGTDGQSIYGDAAKGLAGDMVALLDTFIRSSGSVTTTVNSSGLKLIDYEKELLELESRMERVRERYLTQFAAMQQIVDQMNSTSDYLTSTWNASNKD